MHDHATSRSLGEFGAGGGFGSSFIELDTDYIKSKVVLFTDGQDPKFDQTFSLVDRHSFQIQACLMALARLHYGTPMSSIDYVVAHWRRKFNHPAGSTRPETCYQHIVAREPGGGGSAVPVVTSGGAVASAGESAD